MNNLTNGNNDTIEGNKQRKLDPWGNRTNGNNKTNGKTALNEIGRPSCYIKSVRMLLVD